MARSSADRRRIVHRTVLSPAPALRGWNERKIVQGSTRFALVGPGRAGTALTEALTRAGWTLTGVAGRVPDAPSTRAAADRFGVSPRAVGEVGRSTAVVVVATPDGVVAEVAAELAPCVEQGALVVHLAGSRGLEVFEKLAQARPDVRLGACHPLMTLAGTRADGERLRGAWFAVDGDPGASAVAEAAGGRVFRVADRVSYHAAACVASNHLVALMGQVERLAARAGVPAEAFLPLAEATLANVGERGVRASLTGPVARGDTDTVAAHLDALPESERPPYRAFAREALRLANLAPDAERAVGRLLEGVPIA